MSLPLKIEDKEKLMRDALPFDKSFDLVERILSVGGKVSRVYFIDGFVNSAVLDKVITNLIGVTEDEMKTIKTAEDVIANCISGTEAVTESKFSQIITYFLSGFTIIMVDGIEDAVVMDIRDYPSRETQEPEKEKVMRGSRDGFVETLISNCILMRRRIRDPGLCYELLNVGTRSRTDVAIAYIGDLADKKALNIIREKINSIKTEALTMNIESITECLIRQKWYNPFPKVRMTERPDVASASLLEGNIIVMVDTAPAVLILPTAIFDFLQEPGDFYFPPLVGTYLRMLRNLSFFSTLVLTPIWLLLLQNMDILPNWLQFLNVRDEIFVPIIIQLLILEGAVDILRLASINTPSMLGNSLSIIGALLLGDFAVQAGWLNADPILYMSYIAIASFAQPSIEFNYALKFMRVILLLLTWLFNIWGFAAGILLVIVLIATNTTITGTGYLYPLIPFNWEAMKKHIIRPKITIKNKKGDS